MTFLFLLLDNSSSTESEIINFLKSNIPETVLVSIFLIILFFYLVVWFQKNRTYLSKTADDLNNIKDKIQKHSKINYKNIQVNRPADIYVENEKVLDELATIIVENRKTCVIGLAGSGKTTIVRKLCYDKRFNYFDYKFEVDFEGVNSPIGEKKSLIESLDDAKNIVYGKFIIDKKELKANGANLENYLKNTYNRPCLLFIDNYEQISADRALDSKIRTELIQPFLNCENFHIVITSRERVSGFKSFNLDELKNIPLHNLNIVENVSSKELTDNYSALKLFFQIHNKKVDEGKTKKRTQFTVEEKKAIVKLCHKVSNLPLGIMLLASRSTEISVFNMLENLGKYLKEDIEISHGIHERQRNLYNAILWSFNLLDEDEQRFFVHLTFYSNSTLMKNIPKWINHKSKDETDKLIRKLYDKSLINCTINPKQQIERYEVYYLTREMFSEKMKDENISYNIKYCEAVCRKSLDRLLELESNIFQPQNKIINYNDIVTEVRLELENILFFIKWCSDNRESLAVDLLVHIENILDEIGPYLILDNFFKPLLSHFNSGNYRARLLLAKARYIKSTEERMRAEKPLDEALSILKDAPINSLKGHAFSIATYIYGELGKYNKRKEIIDEVLAYSDIQKKAISKLNLGIIISENGRHFEKHGNIKQATNNFELAIKILNDHNIRLAKILNYSAIFHWRIGDSIRARKHWYESMYRYSNLGENRMILGIKTNLGLLFADTKDDIEEGVKLTLEASKFLEKEGPYGWLQVNILSQGRLISRTATTQNDYDSANELLIKSNKNLEKLKWDESNTLCLTELAELNYKFEKYELACEWSIKAIEKCKNSSMDKSMRYFRSLTLNALANYKLNNLLESHYSAKQARKVINEVEDNQWLNYDVCSLNYHALNKLNYEFK